MGEIVYLIPIKLLHFEPPKSFCGPTHKYILEFMISTYYIKLFLGIGDSLTLLALNTLISNLNNSLCFACLPCHANQNPQLNLHHLSGVKPPRI